MWQLKLFSIIIFLVFLSGCIERESDIDVHFVGEKIVIHGFLTPKGVEVQLQASSAPFDTVAPQPLHNPIVKLFEDDEFVMQIPEKENNFFVTPVEFIPNSSGNYHLTVEVDDFPVAYTAAQRLPMLVEIDTVYIRTVLDHYGFTEYEAVASFKDIPEHTNFYYDRFDIFADGIRTNENIFYYPIYPMGVISDSEIVGQEFTSVWPIKLTAYLPDGERAEVDSISSNLYTLSPDLYQFCYDIREDEGSLTDPFTTQPVRIFSNITNGYGIFGAYNLDTKTIIVTHSE